MEKECKRVGFPKPPLFRVMDAIIVLIRCNGNSKKLIQKIDYYSFDISRNNINDNINIGNERLLATVQRVYELQQVACIVNVNSFDVYELCTRPVVFI